MAYRTAGSQLVSDGARNSGRDGYDVLVLDAASKQSLASVRSLGRSGLRVAVGETFAECDPSLPILAFRSRYSARNVVLPNHASAPAAFAAELLDFIRAHPTRVLLPTMDGTIAALAPCRESLAAAGCTLALPSDSVLDIANSKGRTLKIARELGIACPKTIAIDRVDGIDSALAELEFPIVIKPSTSWSREAAARLQPIEVINRAEAVAAVQAILNAGVGVLAQEWAKGRREGVTMFVVGDEVLAHCACVAYRTTPALGGVSILRESLPASDDIYLPAVNLVRAMGLQGVCEVEFRRDAGGRPLLMEVNARLAGTIENAVRSGVDFPLMIWQWASGGVVDRTDGYVTGVRTRCLRSDMRWLRGNYGRVGRPDSVPRARALWSFGAEFFRTRNYDCFDLHDLGPGFAEVRLMMASIYNPRSPHRNAAPALVK